MRMYVNEVFYPSYPAPHAGITAVNFGICRLSDGYWFDFDTLTFKASGWGTQYKAMTEDSNSLWIYAAGWTIPRATVSYKVNYKVTDASGVFYAQGEIISVLSTQETGEAAPSTAAADIINAIDAAIAAILSGGAVQAYTIAGRNLQRCTLSELKELRKYYVELLATQQGERNGTRNYVSFAKPS